MLRPGEAHDMKHTTERQHPHTSPPHGEASHLQYRSTGEQHRDTIGPAWIYLDAPHSSLGERPANLTARTATTTHHLLDGTDTMGAWLRLSRRDRQSRTGYTPQMEQVWKHYIPPASAKPGSTGKPRGEPRRSTASDDWLHRSAPGSYTSRREDVALVRVPDGVRVEPLRMICPQSCIMTIFLRWSRSCYGVIAFIGGRGSMSTVHA